MGDDEDNIISLEEKKSHVRGKQMVLDNGRKYQSGECRHEGTVIVNAKEAQVECKDCGSLLNPIYVLQLMAAKECYYHEHIKSLTRHLGELEAEIEGRMRTKCTHCGNMTAIKYKNRKPETWLRKPDY